MSQHHSAFIALAALCFPFVSALPAADLTVIQLILQDYEDGPPLPASPRFVEGQTVHLSFLVRNYTPSKDEDAPKVHLFHSFNVVDPEGRPLVATKTGEVEGVLAPEDKEWQPKVRYSFKIPESPSPGIHSVQVRVKDQISGQEAGGTIPFRIDVPVFEARPTLALQAFRYLRSEDEKSALGPDGAVRPGDEFFARFLITGHKLGEGNKYNVRYGLFRYGGSCGRILLSPALPPGLDCARSHSAGETGAIPVKVNHRRSGGRADIGSRIPNQRRALESLTTIHYVPSGHRLI
jgi:hypothetical protein